MEDLSIISLVSRFLNVGEEDESVIIPVERTGNLAEEVSFRYSIVLNDAVDGEDFISSSGRVTFAANQDRIEIQVPILEDNIPELDETFSVFIGDSSEGAVLGFIRTALVTIADNDPVPANTVSFSQGEYTISEDGGEAIITVTRTGNPPEPAQVQYTVTDYSARAGTDYTSTSGTLAFAPGQNSETFTVPIVNDDLVELDESLQLTLSNPIGTTLGPQSFAKLTIEEESTSPDVFWEQEIVGGLSSVGSNTEEGFNSPNRPIVFDWTPDGATMFIGSRGGVVRIFENDRVQAAPFIDLSDRVNVGGQRGMIGLAVHPNFPSTPYVYLSYSYDPPNVEPDLADSPRVTRLVRVEADPQTNFRTALPDSEVILLETDLVNNFHAAGAIKFDAEGALIFTHGDGQTVSEPTPLNKTEALASLDNAYGKMLRIDPITGEGLPDNPFYVEGEPNNIQSKIVNYGFRNPWRYTLHPETGEPFIGDVGGSYWEEINRGTGEFFGWSLYEGGNGVTLRNPNKANDPVYQDLYDTFDNIVAAPIYAESHADDNAAAIVVGDFYTGTHFPEVYQGALFFTDFSPQQDGLVKALVFDEEGNVDSAIPVGFSVEHGTTYMEMGPDGNLWFVNLVSGVVGYWNYEPAGDGSPAAPIITTATAVILPFPENQTFVVDVDARDANGDRENNNGLTYSLTDGADLGKFQIDSSTGFLSFIQAPDVANPEDSNGDNVYEVEVTVTDSSNRTDSELIHVTLASEDIIFPPIKSSELDIYLIDAVTDQAIAIIEEGTQLLLSEIAGLDLTILVEVPSTNSYFDEVESVFLDLNNGEFIKEESIEPYALFGDANGGADLLGGGEILSPGTQTIALDLYSLNYLNGSLLDSVVVNFEVVDDLASTSDLEVGLYDADSDSLITLLEGGEEILASTLQDKNLTISAVVPTDSVFFGQEESLNLNLNNGQFTKVENLPAYALFGNNGNDFKGQTDILQLGANQIELEVFSQNNLGGTLLGAVSRSFTVVDDLAPLEIELIDTATDQTIATLAEGSVIQGSEIEGADLTISAIVPVDSPFFGVVESMFLDLNNGAFTKTENIEPYSLFGNWDGDFFSGGGSLLEGNNTITFDLYSQDVLNGELLATVTTNFSVV